MQNQHTPTMPVLAPPHILYDLHKHTQAAEGQCDCACAASLPSTFLHTMTSFADLSPFALAKPFSYTPLAADYYAILVQRTSAVVVLNQAALNVAQHFEQARALSDTPPLWAQRWGENAVRSTLEQMVNLGLLIPPQQNKRKLTETPVELSAWLHITDRCNLRCAYCYLPHHRVDMSAETGHAAVAATFRSAVAYGYRKVKFKYAGGEPLLRFPLIKELHRRAQELARQNNLTLDGIILSNGTLLTREMVKEMQSSGLRLMLSLDGLGEVHDSQRFYADGRGSFNDVEHAVELALANSLVPDISITISDRNAASLPALLKWVLARDLPFSLNFYRENDLSTSFADLQLTEKQIIAGMLAAFKVIEANLPRRTLLASLVDRANLSAPHLHTCGVGHSYLVFDYLGQVSKCQMQLGQPITTAEADNPLALIRADKIGIQNISVEEKAGCRDCEWKYWCTGGCPLTTYRATGRFDINSPNCTIYTTLYPEAVRLEGLRLLKYANEFQMT